MDSQIVVESDFTPSRTIVIPIDGSPHSEYAVNWTIENIATKTDQIILINARAAPYSTAAVRMSSRSVLTHSMDELDRTESLILLKDTCKHITSKGISVKGIALKGNIREALLNEIEQLSPTMVVVGSKGNGMISRALLGSVSDYLLHHIKVPILVTRK